MSTRAFLITIIILISAGCAHIGAPSDADQGDSTIVHVPAFDLPLSGFLGAESRAVLSRQAEETKAFARQCPYPADPAALDKIVAFRRCADESLLSALIARFQKRYAVTFHAEEIAGIPTEVFTPADGVSVENRERVLINLHGGGFVTGSRTGGRIESIPIAAVGKIKVISVDYRMAPEHRFPAASEDVAGVYKALLKQYSPESIGIYGCSAGGLLAAESLAWFQKEGLPRPGAVGMFCMGASAVDSDSSRVGTALLGIRWPTYDDGSYFTAADFKNPLAFPGLASDTMARFPDSLLITSTRDHLMSSVVATHSQLTRLGVKADLYVWEGLGHGFFSDPDLPESREAYVVIARFFNEHLAPKPEEPFKAEIADFIKADQAESHPPCQVLFVGSSSIVMWKTLAQDMAPLPVINRGFGGSQIENVNLWFDQVVAPYRPRAIVFYAGENDLAAGKMVERVVADFDTFMEKKTVAFRDTPVYFISLKPSKLRYEQLEKQRQVNDAIRTQANRRVDLHYIDVASLMLKDGKPDDLFMPDNLHMNAAGYAIWKDAIKEVLLPNADIELQSCRRRDAP